LEKSPQRSPPTKTLSSPLTAMAHPRVSPHVNIYENNPAFAGAAVDVRPSQLFLRLLRLFNEPVTAPIELKRKKTPVFAPFEKLIKKG